MYFAHHYWGMHLFWWIFWVAMMTLLLWPVWSRSRSPDSALEILRRRYAAGELTEEEYMRRRELLAADADDRARERTRAARPIEPATQRQ